MEIRQLALLSAYLLSDGGLTPKGKTSWTIYFRNKDKAVIAAYQKQLLECAGREGYEIRQKDNTTTVKLHSKKLGMDLLNSERSWLS